ncbi:hypothetical protein [Legionella jamestowniensis]|uniref:Uncharacterized protein n=1 Tax=Legionella jamestowniensis TaxID=455 RepID=A0A0W0UKV0_9GAMM|nr:hypothetical protein [Legionella jamestowniensis]KTD08506.1 hypothetical protein Ljam_2701 [Legionella jamestowniensis]OCH97030.1 hypothetical protein A8135_05195 [Legionella jamestowniensis]SFL52141.1 hypothetical protein SAMN02746073_0645 [Legionella jamestowniensis DSM 19215]
MKIYQSPQPYAVEQANKPQKKPSNLAGSKHKKENETEKKSNKEIYKNKGEEQAWQEVLEKDKL